MAVESRDAVARIGVPAFNELTGLIVNIADSLVEGLTDWSPSLGGTLMAAVALTLDVQERTKHSAHTGLWIGAVLVVEFLPTVAARYGGGR